MLQDASKVPCSHERPGVLPLCGPSPECWGCEGTLRCPGKGASVPGVTAVDPHSQLCALTGLKIRILGFLLAMDLLSVFSWTTV